KYFSKFKENDHLLKNQPIKKMSTLTQRLLDSIDYDSVAKRRKLNWEYMNSKLSQTNLLSFDILPNTVPMVYPYFIKKGFELKQNLIKNRVFVPTYWPNVLKWTNSFELEYEFTKNILAL